jgi:O-antigen chain-terminating methyltransferase
MQETSRVNTLFPVDADLSIDELMQRVRDEVERRRSMRDDWMEEEAAPVAKGERLPRWVGSGRRLPAKPFYELGELLQFTDEEFISIAFRVVLRRPPDEEGGNHYLHALRAGRNKIQILGDLRFSEEGWKNNVHINGLMLPYKLYGLADRRFIGRFIRLALNLGRLPRLPNRLQSAENSSGRNIQELGGVVNKLGDVVDERLSLLEEARVRLEAEVANRASAAALQAADERAQNLAALAAALAERADTFAARADALAAEVAKLQAQLVPEHASIQALAVDSQGHRRSILDLQRKLMTLAQATPKPTESAVPPASVESPTGAVNDILNADYVSFEDSFRGEREDIKQRCAHYLDSLRDASIEPGSGLVLDLGCGRGEWLELLLERGYEARGVDLNAAMLADSRNRGLDVVEADALSYICSLPDASVAAITSMHLVEHLPHDVLIRLLDEAFRVIRPGGLITLETPNPENITVGSCWFYLDPTHRNPIPPQLLQWIVANRGFSEPKIERLSEFRGVPSIPRLSDEVAGAAQINEMAAWFIAAPDYAILARRT